MAGENILPQSGCKAVTWGDCTFLSCPFEMMWGSLRKVKAELVSIGSWQILWRNLASASMVLNSQVICWESLVGNYAAASCSEAGCAWALVSPWLATPEAMAELLEEGAAWSASLACKF